MRVVSLLPSATEIVYALGLGDDLVGVTFECDEPPRARTDKTVVVGGRDTTGMTPGEIDRYVKDQLASGGDLYTLHEGALAGLNPDLILTQDLCRVCALPSGQVSGALDHLGCTADVLSLGVPGRALALVTGLRQRLATVAVAVTGRPRPRVALLEWTDPPFTAGHWIPDLVTAAGGEPVACHPGAPAQQAGWAEIAAAQPDIVVVSPCGYHLDGAAQQAAVAARELPGPEIWAIDADGLVVRPGPRVVDGIEALATVIHPDAVPAAPDGAVRRIRPAG
jgi:iron complex transport system substrate-binding protein